MSLVVHKTLLCDLCGATLIDNRQVLLHAEMTEWRLEAKNRVDVGYKLDLCEECAEPVREAVQERIAVLRGEGRLVGYPQ